MQNSPPEYIETIAKISDSETPIVFLDSVQK